MSNRPSLCVIMYNCNKGDVAFCDGVVSDKKLYLSRIFTTELCVIHQVDRHFDIRLWVLLED